MSSASSRTEADDRARRRAAFLHEAALAAAEERRELGRRPSWKLQPQRVEHFFPRQAAAIDHAVGGLEVERSRCWLKPARRRPTLLRPTTIAVPPSIMTNGGTSWMTRASPPTIASRPMRQNWWTADAAAHVRPLADVNVAAQHRAVGEDHAVADDAIVGHVRRRP